MRITLLTLALILSASFAHAQAVNPRNATWTPASPEEHALLDAYELDFIDSTGTVIQTLTFVNQPPIAIDAEGEVTVSINVQSRQFGSYTAVVRGMGGGVGGPDSDPDAWLRQPGRPGGLRLQ